MDDDGLVIGLSVPAILGFVCLVVGLYSTHQKE